MSVRMSEAELRDFCRRTGTAVPADLGKEQKRPKYGNRKTSVDGRTFDSQHEAEEYTRLALMLKAGEILGLFCQVPFRLPGGVRYIADFVTLERDGTFRVYDAKSEPTRKDKVYRMKRRQMLACLGIEIQEI